MNSRSRVPALVSLTLGWTISPGCAENPAGQDIESGVQVEPTGPSVNDGGQERSLGAIAIQLVQRDSRTASPFSLTSGEPPATMQATDELQVTVKLQGTTTNGEGWQREENFVGAAEIRLAAVPAGPVLIDVLVTRGEIQKFGNTEVSVPAGGTANAFLTLFKNDSGSLGVHVSEDPCDPVQILGEAYDSPNHIEGMSVSCGQIGIEPVPSLPRILFPEQPPSVGEISEPPFEMSDSAVTIYEKIRKDGRDFLHTADREEASENYLLVSSFSVWSTDGSNRKPLHRCIKANGQHFLSLIDNCEGHKQESILGYIFDPGDREPNTNMTEGRVICQNTQFGATVFSLQSQCLSMPGWTIKSGATFGLWVPKSSAPLNSSSLTSIFQKRRHDGRDYFLTKDPFEAVENYSIHTVFRLWKSYQENFKEVHRCITSAGKHFVSHTNACDGHRSEEFLGYMSDIRRKEEHDGPGFFAYGCHNPEHQAHRIDLVVGCQAPGWSAAANGIHGFVLIAD